MSGKAPDTPPGTAQNEPGPDGRGAAAKSASRSPSKERHVASAVLMIRPRHFSANLETLASNRFQASADAPGAAATDASVAHAARAEFDGLVDALERAAIEVHVLDGRDSPVCPDEVFPNNWFSTHADGTLVLYPMLAQSRRAERREDIVSMLGDRGYAVRRIVDLTTLEADELYLEGTGSLVLDRSARIAFACVSPRTSPEAVRLFAERMGYEPVTFGAEDRDGHSIYHTNVMMSVGTDFAVVCAEAVRDERERRRVLDVLQANGKRIVEIDYAQLHAFAGNLLELRGEHGALIALSRQAFASLRRGQLDALAEHGALTAAAIDTIETFGGGSVRCMLAELHLPRA